MLCTFECTAHEEGGVFFVLGEIYEICGDEAWTHGGADPTRYWCFFGGVFGRQGDVDRLEGELRAILASHSHRGEVKWSKLNRGNLNCYIELVDCLLRHVEHNGLKYRQVFLDKSYVWQQAPGQPVPSSLDVQFKICYQFIKHSFGLRHLPGAAAGSQHTVHVRLDNHSSQRHKDELVNFLHGLPAQYNRADLSIRPAFTNSSRLRRMQVCDVIMGAAGSYGNKMHKRRQGRIGMTAKQRARLKLAKHIYGGLRQINNTYRGKAAFNWFESTGRDGNPASMLNHRIRIWKLIPNSHLIDKGWQNDHLDNQGRYQGPQIVQPPAAP